jgi:hypothetical protein
MSYPGERPLARTYEAVRRVTEAVEERWRQSNPGTAPPRRDVTELAASAGLAAITVTHIELLMRLHKELIDMVNKVVLQQPPFGIWALWRIRWEMHRAARTAEHSARDILADLGKLGS